MRLWDADDPATLFQLKPVAPLTDNAHVRSSRYHSRCPHRARSDGGHRSRRQSFVVRVIAPASARSLNATGAEVADADIERLSPARHRHITLTGRYRIALPERLHEQEQQEAPTDP